MNIKYQLIIRRDSDKMLFTDGFTKFHKSIRLAFKEGVSILKTKANNGNTGTIIVKTVV